MGAFPAWAGGAGPLEINQIQGSVEIKPLSELENWPESGPRVKTDQQRKWLPANSGGLVGTYLLRTGPRSYVYLNNQRWCLDPNSLIRVDSAADFGIVVLRGQVSAADGKRGKSLFREYRSDSREGVVR
jgi:hypothetical protein